MKEFSIHLDDETEAWLRAQAGDDINSYMANLIHQDQAKNTKDAAIKQAIQKGIDSGLCDDTIDDIWAEAEAEHKGKHAKISRIA